MGIFKKKLPAPTHWTLVCKPTGKMLLYKDGQRMILKNFTLDFFTEPYENANGEGKLK